MFDDGYRKFDDSEFILLKTKPFKLHVKISENIFIESSKK